MSSRQKLLHNSILPSYGHADIIYTHAAGLSFTVTVMETVTTESEIYGLSTVEVNAASK